MVQRTSHGQNKLARQEHKDQRYHNEVKANRESLEGDIRKLRNGLAKFDSLGGRTDRTNSLKAAFEMTERIVNGLDKGAYNEGVFDRLKALSVRLAGNPETGQLGALQLSGNPGSAVAEVTEQINSVVRDALKGIPESSIRDMEKAVSRFDKYTKGRDRAMKKVSSISLKATTFREWALANGLDALTNNIVKEDVTRIEESIKTLVYAEAALEMLHKVSNAWGKDQKGAIAIALSYPKEWSEKAAASAVLSNIIKGPDTEVIMSALAADQQNIKKMVDEYKQDWKTCLGDIMDTVGIDRNSRDSYAAAREVFYKQLNALNVMLFAKAHIYGSEQDDGIGSKINVILNDSNNELNGLAAFIGSTGVAVRTTKYPMPDIRGSAQDILNAMSDAQSTMDMLNKMNEETKEKLEQLFFRNPKLQDEFLGVLLEERDNLGLKSALRGKPSTVVVADEVVMFETSSPSIAESPHPSTIHSSRQLSDDEPRREAAERQADQEARREGS